MESILFESNLIYFILFHSIISTTFHSIVFYLFSSLLLYSTVFYFILFYFTLLFPHSYAALYWNYSFTFCRLCSSRLCRHGNHLTNYMASQPRRPESIFLPPSQPHIVSILDYIDQRLADHITAFDYTIQCVPVGLSEVLPVWRQSMLQNRKRRLICESNDANSGHHSGYLASNSTNSN
jgi:hypothetical protein